MPHALIIDDDPKNLIVLQQMLTRENISCTAIQDSTKVVNSIPELDKIDVIFLDLEMPNIDGYQLFEALKDRPEIADVPIVACTVYTAELPEARHKGFHSFISKPLDVNRFSNQITRILGGEAIWQTR